MEYTIYNESLVYYALRDKHGRYVCYDNQFYLGDLSKAVKFKSKQETLDMIPEINKDIVCNEFQIRQVKVIDIGEA